MAYYLLPIAILMELVALTIGNMPLSAMAGLVMFVCFLAALGQMQRYALILVLVTIASLLLSWFGGKLGFAELLKAASDAAFYAPFIGCLGTMQCLVWRFDAVRKIHDVLLGGPVIALYPKYAATSCLLGSVLSFGTMSLLCGTLTDTLDRRGITGESRLRWVRSILISALRGFSLVPLVAPTSVVIAILSRQMPEISWSQLLPFGVATSVLMILVGWGLEHRRFRLVSEERQKLDGLPSDTALLASVIAVMLVMMAVLVSITNLNVSRAAMLSVPAVTMAVMSWYDRSPLKVLSEVAANIGSMSNEMTIFAASAALSVAVVANMPADLVSSVLSDGVGTYQLAAIALLMLPLAAVMGIIPITVLSVVVGLVPQFVLAGEGIDPLLIAIALMTGFALTMLLSPFGLSVMLLSRFGQVSRLLVAFKWNGLFVVILIPLLLALQWFWQVLLS